nr:immunoglobulin light chain junction region [Mus musculus]NSM00281.1 immunoglobulin light chain junction region [Mus musculus]NSM01621.1 immunoglobulin light chain junction region [Mus musculus]
CLQSRKVPWTF